jgi:hypothetical protein
MYQFWARIGFQSSDGTIGSLYLAKAKEILGNMELPPLPPAGVFDARYSSNTNVETVEQSRHEILLSSATYPLTIRAENLHGVKLRLKDAVSGRLFDATLSEGKSLIVTQKIDRLILEVDGQASEIPTQFALGQNYPNPFNPSTVIKYALPQKSHVTLTVYNTLGQQVSVLVNTEQEAGYHDVKFENPGLASGVYLYRMQAGSFVEVKKLVLVK